ncbi:MAG TPA: DUF924 family protein [Xanthobacteraceae bacterium]|nr:DUF924 family protein [Xanthobacteraceae bacterium]
MAGKVAAPEEVLSFWREAGPKRWFKVDPSFDDAIRERFLATWEAARAGGLAAWEQTSEGALALLLVIDQFPRNMFRGDARSFATDAEARAVAARAIERTFDQAIAPCELNFFYLPYMHSEALADQERAVALMLARGDAEGIKHAGAHRDLIRRFGRFPFRNQALGRTSTPAEAEYLAAGGYRV